MSFRFIHYIHVRWAVQLVSPLRLNGNSAHKRMDSEGSGNRLLNTSGQGDQFAIAVN